MAGNHRGRQQLFEGNAQQSAAYAKHRPVYSRSIYDAIFKYAGETRATECALDVATGTGQVAGELCKHYTNVIAQDISQTQLDQAAKSPSSGPNIRFQQSAAEMISLPDESVDLLTIAQALHWVDQTKAFAEFARVLKPGGTLAAWGYDMPKIVDEPDGQEIFRRLHSDTLGPYWNPRRQLVSDHYRDISIPPPFIDEERCSFDMKVESTVGGLLGNISSWSAYQTYISENKTAQDPVMRFHGELKEELEFVNHSTELDLSYPVFMILARKPAVDAPTFSLK